MKLENRKNHECGITPDGLENHENGGVLQKKSGNPFFIEYSWLEVGLDSRTDISRFPISRRHFNPEKIPDSPSLSRVGSGTGLCGTFKSGPEHGIPAKFLRSGTRNPEPIRKCPKLSKL